MTRDPGPHTLTTTDGVALEAEWSPASGSADAPLAVVVLAHPHPAHGGNMRSLVTSELFRELPARNLDVLRFNFRGVGASGGHHEGGRAERADVSAAVAFAASASPGVAVIVSGWSFGADVSLAVVDPQISGWFAVAPPLRVLPADAYLANHDPRPKVLAVPEHDEFNPPEQCTSKIETWTATTLRVITGADHFLVGRTGVLVDQLEAFAATLGASTGPGG